MAQSLTDTVQVDLSTYTQSRMSPFDEHALRLLLDMFERRDLRILEIGSWMGADPPKYLPNTPTR